MRFALIFILTILIPFTAQANRISADMADAYYQDCKSKERPKNLRADSQDKLCACTASKMIETMTTDDVRDLTNEDQEIARDAFNFMLVNVYAPCMELPTRDHYYATCISNKQTHLITKEPQVMCECVSNKVSTYIAQNGPDVFEEILERNPNVQDPMAALESDTKFQNYVKKQGIGCLM